jgi:hypothetical protein
MARRERFLQSLVDDIIGVIGPEDVGTICWKHLPGRLGRLVWR